MRMLLHARIPHEEFNAAVRDSSVGRKMKQILDETRAEAVYFTEYDGRRGAIMIINIDSAKVCGTVVSIVQRRRPISHCHDPGRIRAGRP
jgi:hypothetical protein